ncbi:unnamed protein product [Ostreobium quekettii]|uniref:Ammonium transporter n=1 Tax=Ostreobium quekettii TaxID=121088 RepID=A0A8S1IJZ6_9CHLO|nr:unnamed protein product [Ostreobium quekettii]|eukprot:evm.model.scf_363.7 EVM.evm.TU.scf_363.7   scf_363:67511-72552(+)
MVELRRAMAGVGGRGLLQDPAPAEEPARLGMVTLIEPKGQLATDLDILWLLFGAYLVFFMQCGFAVLEAGSVRAKNTKNILLKNVLDACLGALVWYGWGYSFAYGEGGKHPNEFIGGTNFFMSNSNDVSPDPELRERGLNNANEYFALWLFQWAFAATAATIVSGAVAERCQFRAYLTYTFVITGLIYPVVVHWAWSSEGWLSAFRDVNHDGEHEIVFEKSVGLIDFAGSGVVHMTGGGAALMAAIILGPRYGRFAADGSVIDLPGSSIAFTTLGVLILWFGWYGFNPVSTLAFYGSMYVASKAAVTTTLAAAAGGVTVLVVHVAFHNQPDVAPALNGILAGLVSITAGCSVVEPYGSVCIGIVGGIVYYFSSWGLKKLQIDDPLDASPVHFFSGMWGVLSVGFFATPVNLENAYGSTTDVGIFYGGEGHQLGVQLLGATAIGVWTCGISFVLFMVLRMTGSLRVAQEDEITGLDMSHHGGTGYGIGKVGGVNPNSITRSNGVGTGTG